MAAASKKIVLSGIMVALTLILLFAESIIPSGKLGLFALSSFITAIIVIECGVKTAWVFYIAVTILGFLLIPDKLGVIPYGIFFGVYGIIKHYVEKMERRIQEFLLKYAYFNLCVWLAYLLMKQLFLGDALAQFPIWGIVLGLQVVFLIYDYVFSAFIQYYQFKIKNKLTR